MPRDKAHCHMTDDESTTPTMTLEQRTLALDILRCTVAHEKRQMSASVDGCHVVANWTPPNAKGGWPCPEPWTGHISVAPMLFVASNPSAERHSVGIGAEPLADWRLSDKWNEDAMVRAGEDAYDRSEPGGIADGSYEIWPNGARKYVRYWGGVQRIARELFGRDDVRPGWDYALTEVVHCATSGEAGIHAALPVCADRYLQRILAIASARVIVCVGRAAEYSLVPALGIALTDGMWGPNRLRDRLRIVCALRHPSAHGAHSTAEDQLGTSGLRVVQALLTEV